MVRLAQSGANDENGAQIEIALIKSGSAGGVEASERQSTHKIYISSWIGQKTFKLICVLYGGFCL